MYISGMMGSPKGIHLLTVASVGQNAMLRFMFA